MHFVVPALGAALAWWFAPLSNSAAFPSYYHLGASQWFNASQLLHSH